MLFSDRWLLMLSVAIGVQHTEVPNLWVVSEAFFPIGGYCCFNLLYGSNTQRCQIWEWLVVFPIVSYCCYQFYIILQPNRIPKHWFLRLGYRKPKPQQQFFCCITATAPHLKNVISGWHRGGKSWGGQSYLESLGFLRLWYIKVPNLGVSWWQ